jgi:hypothetical protein
VNHYLHFESDSLLADLSDVFGVAIREDDVQDVNPIFNKLLHGLQKDMQPYLREYKPYDRIPFPFIVCVVGPRASGRTTVCQFLQRAFDVTIIECRQLPGEAKSKGKPPPETATEAEETIEYPLTDSVPVRYRDDKDCVQQLATAIKDRLGDGKGFVVCGYPTAKNQFANLEKA